jgi:hypothetical protein
LDTFDYNIEKTFVRRNLMNLWDALLEAIGVEVEVDVELAIGDRQIIGEGAQKGGTEEAEEE